MRSLLLTLLFLFAAGVAHSAPPPALQAALEHAMAGSKTPAVAAVVLRNGQASKEAVRSVRQTGRPAPDQPGDRWLLGSDGKAMTAALIARLVDQGKLSWTTPLETMLPALAAGMRPEYRSVTLVDLLSHRSGLPENLSDEAYFRSLY